ncbi:MAG: MCP four helix bundle domain-containing protein [Chthoniobacterales bacterium]
MLLISNLVLLLALLISGLANFFFLKRLDDRYSLTLAAEIRGAILIRSVTRDSLQRQRAITNLLLAAGRNDAAQIQVNRDIIKSAIAKNDASFRELDELINDPDTQIKFNEVIEARMRYNREVEKVVEMFNHNQIVEATHFKDEVLRPLFTNYLEKQDNLAQKLESSNGEKNNEISSWSSFFQWITIGLSTWPMILVCVLVFGLILWSLLIGWNMPDEQV